MKHQISFFILFSVLFNCTSQPPPEFTSAQLARDFELYRTALEEAHPGLYRYHSRPQFDSLFTLTRASLNAIRTRIGFYEKLAAINSFIGCGHTATLLPSDLYKKAGEKRLPFDVRIKNGKAFIYQSHTNDKDYAPGTEIIYLEQPFTSISDRMMPLLRADGYIQSSKWRDLGDHLSYFLQVFIKPEGPYTASLRSPEGKEISKQIHLINVADVPPTSSQPDLQLNLQDDPSLAIMTIRSFMSQVTDDVGNGFEKFLKQSFQQIQDQRIDKLIIDVRGNGGGRDDYGALLFSYLTDAPFSYYAYLEIKEPAFSFLEHTNKSQSFLNELLSSATQTHDGRWLLNENQHSCLTMQKPSQPTFKGEVIVLIDGKSFSATAEFCSVALYHKRATFVGEETSGTYEGNNSGGSILLTLPETKIRVAIPTYKYVMAVDIPSYPKGRGITPDISVEPSIHSLADGIDDAMDFATRLIGQ